MSSGTFVGPDRRPERRGGHDPSAFSHRWTSALFRAITPIRDLLQGRWLGHPLHLAATDIPIGLLLGSVILDLIGQRQRT